MFVEELGERIKLYRTKLNLTQNDLANAIQVSSQAVSKWERGENAPDIAVIPKLASLFDVSIDSLFGFRHLSEDTFEATIFVSDIQHFTERTKSLSMRDAATVLNGHYYQLTESILNYDGIPVKYIGDEFVCFFSGEEHRNRAIQAALHAKRIISEEMSIGLSSGNIYFGLIGHPDYARQDILGRHVQDAFGMCIWSRKKTKTGIGATQWVVDGILEQVEIGHIKEVPKPPHVVKLYEIVGCKGS